MKKNKIILLVLLLALCTLITTIWAVMTSNDKRMNDFTLTDLKAVVKEEFDKDKDIEPDAPYDKKAWVKNTSDAPAFIRVMVWATIIDSDGETLLPADDKVIEIGWNEEESGGIRCWMDGGDGYYYYTKRLMPGDTTEVLIDEVTFLDKNDIYNEAKLDVDVKVEAASTENGARYHTWWNGNEPSSGKLKEIEDILKDAAASSQEG